MVDINGGPAEVLPEDLLEALQTLAKAVRGGDLRKMKALLGEVNEDQRNEMLVGRLLGDTISLHHEPGRKGRGRMPSVKREVSIREPTLLILAAARLNPELLQYLASFQVFA